MRNFQAEVLMFRQFPGPSVGIRAAALVWAGLCAACSSEPVEPSPAEPADERDGVLLELDVPESGVTRVDLSEPAVVSASRESIDWDVAFAGFEVFTNSGVSGPGAGASFGPLSAPTFLSDSAPSVPFLTRDEPGGAFLRWYAYDGGSHYLLTRFHVYGLRDGERYFKVQILTYYGEQAGAPVPAAYTVRYAEVMVDGAGPTRTAAELDGTEESDATECLNVDSGERLRLTADEATTDDRWHLCFRRDSITVNGGTGGPRGVEAIDLDAGATATEQVAAIRELTAESELARFERVDHARLSDASLEYRPDSVASAFAGRWLAPNVEPPQPGENVWFVLGADGVSRYLLRFESFSGSSSTSPGRIALRVKAVL